MPNRNRNYARFAKLANVRNYNGDIDIREPFGIPSDVSDTVKYYIEKWGRNGHSHSYLSIKDAAEIFRQTEEKINKYQDEYPIDTYFNISDEEIIDNMRLVFWFDN